MDFHLVRIECTNASDPRVWWKRSIVTLLSPNLFCLILPPSQRRAVVTYDPNKPVSLKSIIMILFQMDKSSQECTFPRDTNSFSSPSVTEGLFATGVPSENHLKGLSLLNAFKLCFSSEPPGLGRSPFLGGRLCTLKQRFVFRRQLAEPSPTPRTSHFKGLILFAVCPSCHDWT